MKVGNKMCRCEHRVRGMYLYGDRCLLEVRCDEGVEWMLHTALGTSLVHGRLSAW